MSENELVRVPSNGALADRATLLLAGAESLGLDPSVVRTDTGGAEPAFIVPKEVAEKALNKSELSEVTEHVDPFEQTLVGEVVTETPAARAEAALVESDDNKTGPDADKVATPAKKTAAKKTAAKRPAKKTAAKKTAAKKAPAKKAAATPKASE